MYDRLPTPFGLVRGGVAPDHQKIKSVTRVYDKIAAHPEFRFYGNVEMGRDLTHDDLSAYYHAIIYAVGARTDRRMGIPREHLPGSHSATEFVGWYNAHPDFRHLRLRPLRGARRWWSATATWRWTWRASWPARADELAGDRHRRARPGRAGREPHPRDPRARPARPGPGRVHQQGAQGARRAARRRRGRRPGRARAGPRARGAPWRPRPTAPATATWRSCASYAARAADRRAAADRPALPGLAGGDPRHRARRGAGGRPTTSSTRARTARCAPARPSAARRCPLGLVFRAIGYQGVPLPGIPFDAMRGRDPQRGRADHRPAHRRAGAGRVRGRLDQARPAGDHRHQQARRPGDRATRCWRTSRAGRLDKPEVPSRAVLERLLAERRRDFVSYDDWQLIDLLEQERGAAGGAAAGEVQPRRGDARTPSRSASATAEDEPAD